MSSRVDFSIVITSYNRNTEILSLFDNLALQTFKNFEVVLIDDGSEPPILIQDRKYDFPVKIFRNSRNLGQSKSRNLAVKRAEGDWIIFLDDDDRFSPYKCEKLKAVIDRFQYANFIYHPARCHMVNEGFTYTTRPSKNLKNVSFVDVLAKNLVGTISTVSIKRNFFNQVNGFSEEFQAIEDYELFVKLFLSKNLEPIYIPEVLTDYFVRTGCISVSKDENKTLDAIKRIEIKYALTGKELLSFKKNAYLMLAFPLMMKLSRQSAVYYFRYFLLAGFPLKYLVVSILAYLSPKLVINLKRFF